MTNKILLGMLLALILIQFIEPVRNESSASQPDDIFSRYAASDTIRAMINTSCYDCHSNNSEYPWYAEIQPLAWWLNYHIKEGKDELNFSDFAAFNTRFKSHKLDEIMELVDKKEMPLKSYLITHSEARLSEKDRKEIIKWAGELKARIKGTEP
ncbi:MAG: heme-binding domain-containing protein [Bacteroidota bacterium]